ncbi:MAG: hypothetical protein R3E83_05715 [Burkholderiaceae bacterium]
MFSQLASAALGRPSAIDGLLSGREAAAALLIVRECMHHLGFETLVIDRHEPHAPDARPA